MKNRAGVVLGTIALMVVFFCVIAGREGKMTEASEEILQIAIPLNAPLYKEGELLVKMRPGAPKVPGKNALIFCTYSGPHTGIREAIPAGLYAGQYFEHLGFTVLDEWYVVGEFHGSLELSTQGRLGDIRGRPNEDDLRKVKEDSRRLVEAMEK